MQVRFLQRQDYEPTPSDTVRCWGQLRMRDGRTYFPNGSTPDLSEDVARRFVTLKVAEPFHGQDVVIQSSAEIQDGMPEQK